MSLSIISKRIILGVVILAWIFNLKKHSFISFFDSTSLFNELYKL